MGYIKKIEHCSLRAWICLIAIFWSTQVWADCLEGELDRRTNAWILRNVCDKDIVPLIRSTRGGCAPTEEMEYPCSMHIDAFDNFFLFGKFNEVLGKHEDLGEIYYQLCDFPLAAVEVRRGHVICADARKGEFVRNPYLFEDGTIGIDSWANPDLKPFKPTKRADRKENSVDKGVVRDDVISPAAQEPIKKWMKQHKISSTDDIASTLALMVQTALTLQAFDPGPADGVFGKLTLAAMIAWQTMQGFPEGAELAGLIAAILRAALVLEGYDPGPVEEMFGPTAIEAVQAWAPSYEQAARNQESRDRFDRLSPPTSWRTVPHAMDCVSFVNPGGPRNYQYIRNHCDFKIDVHWCYTDRPDDNDYCTLGPAGLGYMDRVDHRATRRGVGPDYYTSSERLRARQTSPKPLEPGAIRYIACGHRPLRNAQQYVTEWDAHNGSFRCLVYAPEQDDGTAAEGTAE